MLYSADRKVKLMICMKVVYNSKMVCHATYCFMDSEFSYW